MIFFAVRIRQKIVYAIHRPLGIIKLILAFPFSAIKNDFYPGILGLAFGKIGVGIQGKAAVADKYHNTCSVIPLAAQGSVFGPQIVNTFLYFIITAGYFGIGRDKSGRDGQ